jgi:hypothetical protein
MFENEYCGRDILMAKKTRKERIPAGVKQEFDDVDYWHDLKKSAETVTLADGTVLSVYDYMKKFMQEAYGNGFSRQNPDENILQTDDQKKWARRNNNNTNRDALLVSQKKHALYNAEHLLDVKQSDITETWETTLKTGTYEEALEHLLVVTANELKIELTPQMKRGMLNFYFRIKKFLSYLRKDKKNERV